MASILTFSDILKNINSVLKTDLLKTDKAAVHLV